MATATKQTVPPAPPVEVVKSVTLVLTLAPACTIAVMCAKVGGDPDRSARKNTDSISAALKTVDINYRDAPEYHRLSGGIGYVD